jgi:hypothetical protein
MYYYLTCVSTFFEGRPTIYLCLLGCSFLESYNEVVLSMIRKFVICILFVRILLGNRVTAMATLDIP